MATCVKWVIVIAMAGSGTADTQEVADLIGVLQGVDESARLSARERLSEIGPDAVEPLLNLLASEQSRVEQAARQTLLSLVMRWSNTAERRERVSQPLLKVAASRADVAIRQVALSLLGKVADERVTPRVADLLRDPAVALAACSALQHIPGTLPTAALTQALEWAQPELQVALLHAVGARRDRQCTPEVAARLRSPSSEVRKAAAEALGQIGGPSALEALTQALTDNDQGVRIAAANACLAVARQCAADEARQALYKVLHQAPNEAILIGALTGLGQVGDETSVEPAARLLKHESRRVQIAAVVALSKLPGASAMRALTDALRSASPYVVIAGLHALGERGDADAVAAVQSLASDPNKDIRLRALWALGRLRSSVAIRDLQAATHDADADVRATALDAYANLAHDLAERGKREEARTIYEDLARLPERGSHWAAGVEGLGRIGSAKSLPVLADILQDAQEEKFDRALSSYLAICAALAEAGERESVVNAYVTALDWVPALGGLEGEALNKAWTQRSAIAQGLAAAGATDRAKALYREALTNLPAGAVLEEAARALMALGEPVDMAALRGFLREWWVIGPFPNENWGAWDRVFFPEEEIILHKEYEFDGQVLRWKKQSTDQVLDLVGPFGGVEAVANKACYALAEFLVEEAQPVTLKIGSDDGIIVWLNGERVHENKVDRGCQVDQDIASANVRVGVNRLLCKVFNNAGGFNVCVRLCDTKGRALRFTQSISGGGEAKVPFRKIQLADGTSLVEACTVLDVNRDGKLDVASGGYWYEAPEWTRHHYREVTNDGSYANDWAEFALDVNGDGWTDIISGGFHTDEISWYENPQGQEVLWTKHLAWSRGNEFYETMLMVDIDGDGQGDFLPNAGAPVRWYEVVIKNGQPEFVRHDVGLNGAGHGIGYGDVNLDGRLDILTPTGWYEAPADRRAGDWIWHGEWNLGSTSVPILAHDADGDGRTEVFWGGGHEYGLFSLVQSEEGGARSWRQYTIDASFSQAHAPELADINSDGSLDIVVGKRWKAHCGKDPGTDDPLYVYWFELDKQTKRWRRWVVSYDDGAGIGLQQWVGDLDGDGDQDIVSACKTGLHLFINESNPPG